MKNIVVNIGGRNFFATLVDKVTSAQGLYINGSLFRISNKPEGEILGCLSLFRSQSLSHVWNPPIASRELLDALYKLILPYIKIDIDPEKIFKMYSDCFTIVLDVREDGTYDDETVINGGGNAQELVERLVYGGQITDIAVRKQILQYLYDYWKFESHNTKLLVGKIKEILFVPTNYFDRNLDYLIQKQLVEHLSQNDQLISVKISLKGVEYVENGFQEPLSAVQVVQYMGDQINTTISGDNNTVNIKGQLSQLFLSIETEIESKNEPNKEEVLKQVSELKTEMEETKDFSKIQTILGKIKNSASWVHEKIIKHPVFAQIIAQAVSNQLGLSSTQK